MAVFATTGKNNNGIKRVKARFGGDSAWRQHGDEKSEKQELILARRRADSQHVSFLVGDCDFEKPVPGHICPSTGIQVPVLNGPVREGNIVLVYSEGKLLSAHCG